MAVGYPNILTLRFPNSLLRGSIARVFYGLAFTIISWFCPFETWIRGLRFCCSLMSSSSLPLHAKLFLFFGNTLHALLGPYDLVGVVHLLFGASSVLPLGSIRAMSPPPLHVWKR